mmetsp:Transcript_35100/g.35616  ORF Transcript_35100/g.35616 Transcript_35100/m.35616 type:complete len:93 (-) Transcript_35100:41-319(-)
MILSQVRVLAVLWVEYIVTVWWECWKQIFRRIESQLSIQIMEEGGGGRRGGRRSCEIHKDEEHTKRKTVDRRRGGFFYCAILVHNLTTVGKK